MLKENLQRQEIIRQNASRRLRGLPALAVPPKVTRFGYAVSINGDFAYFARNSDRDDVLEEIAFLQDAGQVESGRVTLRKEEY